MLYETDDLEWHEVRDFFEAHGCVICGSPEMRWYQESWGALKRAGLADTTEFEEDELAETIPKLRAICLLAMYLGIYQAETIVELAQRGLDVYVPDSNLAGELRRGKRAPGAPAGWHPEHRRMRRKLCDPAGRAVYQRRKAIVEPSPHADD